METKKKRGGGESLKIEAGSHGGQGGGWVIVISGALVAAAAVGAAFAAHRARGDRHRNAKKKEEEKELQSLLPSAEQQQENTSEKSEVGETIESEESVRTGTSSADSSADQVVWPEEVIEKREDSALVELIELKQASEMTENFEDEKQLHQSEGSSIVDHGDEEFAFDSSVKNQETTCDDCEIIKETGEIQGSYKIPEIKRSEIEEATTIGSVNDEVNVEEFSFWNGKSSTPEIHTEQNLIDLETNHIPEEQKESCNEEGSEVVEAWSTELNGDAAWPATPIEQEETSDMKQQLEISEKTDDICGSVGEENRKTLQDLIASANCIEKKKGQDFVDSSEEAQEIACNDFKMVVEILESHNASKNSEVVENNSPHLEGEEEEGLSIKSQREIELQLKDVGARREEELEGSRNSLVEFSDQAVWPEDKIEQEGDDSMLVSEMKHKLGILRNVEEVETSIYNAKYNNQLVKESVSGMEINMPANETGEILEESDIANVETEEEADGEQEGSSAKSLEEEKMLPVEEESEGGESIKTGNFLIESDICSDPVYEMKQELESPEKNDEMVDEAHAEETENTTEGIQRFLLSDDKHKEVSVDSSIEVQEKVYMNLDMETKIDLEHDVVKACLYSDVAFNSSQGQNQQGQEESEIAHVEEEEEEEVDDPSVGSQEEEIESPIEEDVMNQGSEEISHSSVETTEEEKGLPSIENEMKLQFEIPQKAINFRQTEQVEEKEQEQQVLKKGSEYKEKRMDFALIGSLKLFLLVLITLAVGLLAFAHHDHLHHYNHRCPKIYRQLYQLFFRSCNEDLGEL